MDDPRPVPALVARAEALHQEGSRSVTGGFRQNRSKSGQRAAIVALLEQLQAFIEPAAEVDHMRLRLGPATHQLEDANWAGLAPQQERANLPHQELVLGVAQYGIRQQHLRAELLVELLDSRRRVHGIADRPVLVVPVRPDRGEGDAPPIDAEPRAEAIVGQAFIELASRVAEFDKGAEQLALRAGAA